MNKESLSRCLNGMKPERIALSRRDNDTVVIYCVSDEIPDTHKILKAKKKTAELLQVPEETVDINVRINGCLSETDSVKVMNTIIGLAKADYPSLIGLYNNSEITIKDKFVYVSLRCKGAFLFTSDCKAFCERKAVQMTGEKYIFIFEDTSAEPPVSGPNDEEVVILTKPVPDFGTEMIDASVQKKPADSAVVLGKAIKEPPIKIRDIGMESGRLTISGEIFSVEDVRITKTGKAMFLFDVTDKTGSFRIKSFTSEKDASTVKDKIKVGTSVILQGEVIPDSYYRDLVFFAKNIGLYPVEEKMDRATVKRVELHLHSKMSSMDAVTDISQYIERADKWGHKAIAVTDHGVVQAFPQAYKAVTEVNKNRKTPMKLIYGMEGYLIDEESEKKRNHHIILLVKTQEGIKNLYKIVSESHLYHFRRNPSIPRELIEKHREGLIIGSACESGELFRKIIKGADRKELLKTVEFYDYLEIQPIGNNSFLIREGIAENEETLRDYNRLIADLADEAGIPCVATCDVHFINPEDECFRRILMAAKGFKDADVQPPLFFRTTDEMLDEFRYLGETKAYEVVVKNTVLISDMIDDIRPIPEGTFPPVINGAEKDVRAISERRAKELYGEDIPEIIRKRMDKELNSIINNNFSVLYIIAMKIVKKSNDDGYLVGSRGSVGSSFIAYLLGITEVNSEIPHYRCGNKACLYSEFSTEGEYECGFDMPNKNCPNCGELLIRDGYDIPFETFLGFEGNKEPDIDLNFSGVYQPRAHKYAEDFFGEGKVFRAGTIGTVAEKTAIGYVLKYKEERDVVLNQSEQMRLSKGCEGVKRTTSQHPGGIMIIPSDKEVYDFTPIQHPADDSASGTITTHFDYNFLHGAILKLDLLGHADPTAIKMLETLTGINARTIEIGDPEIMSLFSSTEALGVTPEQIDSKVGTLGIPEFGTVFVRQMLEETMPTRFSELIRISGLSHGTDVWTKNAQDLINNGVCSLREAICCRDDIMLYLSHQGLPPISAFSIMENVRKGKGLKPDEKKLMKKHGVPEWYITSCERIQYMFPKAHAAAYVMMAFRIAWFKVFYPVEYYTVYFSTRAPEFDVLEMTKGVDYARHLIKNIKMKGYSATAKEKNMIIILEVVIEMYMRGIEFLSIDIYKSHATDFTIDNGFIRPPLSSLPGLGEAAADKIAEARMDGEFNSQDELRLRTGISKTVVENLIECGAINELQESNQFSLFE